MQINEPTILCRLLLYGGSARLQLGWASMPGWSLAFRAQGKRISISGLALQPKWSDVKQVLEGLEHRQLIALIQTLYQLSAVNKDFLHARFGDAGGSLDRYKSVIEKCLCPDHGGTFAYKKAENGIRDYFKATSDVEGMADLMIRYVECGNDFTLEFGDIDEAFYDRLLRMYDKAIASGLKLPKSKQQSFKDRLAEIRDAADGIGWGYHDGLEDSL